MALYQLIYQSVAQVPFDTLQLRELVHRSNTYNRSHDITGILLYTPDGRFLQVLEGERETVRELYRNHISRDSRHYFCRIVSEGNCLQRSFGDWSLAFRHAQARDLRILLSSIPAADVPGLLIPRPHTRPELIELLLEFVDSSTPVAAIEQS